MLELKGVRKVFNTGTVNEKVALDGIDLHLLPGDFVTIIGGNGAGKSTMLNTIAGAYLVDAGTVTVNGTDVTFMSEAKRAKFLGRVFQDPRFGTATDMQIDENLALAARRGKRRTLAWGITHEERELFRERLARLGLGLENRLSDKVGLLSGGQRQALTLLMATIQSPDVLLLDEHTAALDPKTAALVLEITEEVVTENNLTTLMVTHNMHDAIRMGNRLIMMSAGKIIFDVRGEEKSRLQISDLMKKFEEAAGVEFDNDRMLLG